MWPHRGGERAESGSIIRKHTAPLILTEWLSSKQRVHSQEATTSDRLWSQNLTVRLCFEVSFRWAGDADKIEDSPSDFRDVHTLKTDLQLTEVTGFTSRTKTAARRTWRATGIHQRLCFPVDVLKWREVQSSLHISGELKSSERKRAGRSEPAAVCSLCCEAETRLWCQDLESASHQRPIKSDPTYSTHVAKEITRLLWIYNM